MEQHERLSDDARNEKLIEFLKDMASFDTDVETCHENYVRTLSEIYLDQDGNQIYRHNYSSITRFMYRDWDTTEAYSLALENMRLLETKLDDGSALNECLRKLCDHVDLECLHMGRIWGLQMTQGDVAKTTEKTNEIIGQVREIDKNVDKIKEDLKEYNVQIVSVLGIFAGVVFAFSGGFSMLSSVFSDLNKIRGMQALLLVSVVLFAGVVLYDVVYLLLSFIASYFLKERTAMADIGVWTRTWNQIVLSLATIMLIAYLCGTVHQSANAENIEQQDMLQNEKTYSVHTPSDG